MASLLEMHLGAMRFCAPGSMRMAQRRCSGHHRAARVPLFAEGGNGGSELEGIDAQEPEGDPQAIDEEWARMIEEENAKEWHFDVGAPGREHNPFPDDANVAEDQYMMGMEPNPDDKRVVALPAVFLAGFRAEEMPHVRLLIDKLGGSEVPVIPITSEMTKRKVKDILYEEEMDWSQPRPSGVLGGGDGSERCILFSGLDAGERATVVSELERQGLPRMGCSVVYMDDLTREVGSLLGEAVEELRNYERSVRRSKEVDPSTVESWRL